MVGATDGAGAGCGGDSGCATVEEPAKGDEALGRCLSIRDNGPPRTGTLSDDSAGFGPSRLRRLPDSSAGVALVAGASGAGEVEALVKGVNDTPENALRGILA